MSRRWLRGQTMTLTPSTWSCTSLSWKDKLFLCIKGESQQAPGSKLHILFWGLFCTELLDKIKC